MYSTNRWSARTKVTVPDWYACRCTQNTQVKYNKNTEHKNTAHSITINNYKTQCSNIINTTKYKNTEHTTIQ